MKSICNNPFVNCFLFVSCFFCSLSLPAQSDSSFQKKKKPVFYFSPGLSVTNKHPMPGLGFTMMKKNGWGASLEVKINVMQAQQMPADFQTADFFFLNQQEPHDILVVYTLSVVKDFSKRKKIAPGLIGGVAYIEKNTAANFVRRNSVDFGLSQLSANYYFEHTKTRTAGIFIKPKLKYLFSQSAAPEIAAWAIVTSQEKYYGVELNFLFGRIK